MTAPRPQVVLVQPRIPQNVGSIGRTCAAARAGLHIVRPIPFDLSDRSLARAGMDYMELLDLHVHTGWEECEQALAGRRFFFLSSHATTSLYDVDFQPSDVLVFGSEVAGLPPALHHRIAAEGLRIPMPESAARCLNLANAASIALYELLRRSGEFGVRSAARP